MSEQGSGRYDRSRYGSNARNASRAHNGSHESGGSASRWRGADSLHRFNSNAEERRASRSRDGFFKEAHIADDAHGDVIEEPRDGTREAAGETTGAQAKSRYSATAAAPRKGNRRGLSVALCILAAVVLVGAGAAWAYISGVSGNLRAGIDRELLETLVETDMANEPFYMLLLGTDGSAERDATGDFGSYRSDTIILARVDAPNHKVTLVSFPRDIPVDLGEYGEEKINAAFAVGGPALTVKVVSELAGVDISHYAQVDFDGFTAIVDTLGGIEVNVPTYINDDEAGGVVEAGEQVLNGDQALILCRSRNTYADSVAPDTMRAANQRLVIGAIAKKALSADIGTIASTVRAASQYVTTDLAINDIIGLAQIMRGLDPDTDVYTACVPTTSQYVDYGWYEFIDKSAWKEMMKRVDAGLPPTEESVIDESTGVVLSSAGDGAASTAVGNIYSTVTVKNGTDIQGLATRLRAKLLDAGYVNLVIGDVNADYSYPNTLVVYTDPARKAEAQALLDIMGQGELYYDDPDYAQYVMEGTDFLIVIGNDWQSSSTSPGA